MIFIVKILTFMGLYHIGKQVLHTVMVRWEKHCISISSQFCGEPIETLKQEREKRETGLFSRPNGVKLRGSSVIIRGRSRYFSGACWFHPSLSQ